MLLPESIGDLAVFSERPGGADFVEIHEARVACDVGRDYGSEPASDTRWLVLLNSAPTPTLTFKYTQLYDMLSR